VATAVAQLSDNFTNPPAPVPGHGHVTYLTMTGARTGAFTGGVTLKGHAGAIEVLGLDGGLTDQIDSSTGQATGKTLCTGINFRKPTDRSTPQLFNAAATLETITTATFDEYQVTSTGALQVALQIKLTNAHVTSIHHVTATTTGAFDDVTLVPSTVRVTWKPANVFSQHNCTAGAA
jgi:type VI secretion system secreted protein Hcp